MNNKIKSSLFTLLILMTGKTVYAYDIKVDNADGVTIYYNYINEGKELEVAGADNYGNSIVIPEEVTYMNRKRIVTSIGDYAFAYHGPKDVTLPNSVIYIKKGAFVMSELLSINLPNKLTYIGDRAFQDCAFTTISIPNSVKTIEAHAFQSCDRLKVVSLGNSVTRIGDAAFNECPIEKVIIMDISVWCNIEFGDYYANPTLIAHHIYSDENNEIIDLYIPNGVTSIKERVFSGCNNLKSVSLPNSVISIGDYAFENCEGITSITIPQNVTSMGHRAFDGCDFTTVTSQIENPKPIISKEGHYYEGTFSLNTYNNATLYVPAGTIGKYKSTEGWKDFLYIEEGDGSSSGQSTQRCEKPTISYSKGKLTFNCATSGATCKYTINDTDIKSGSGDEVKLGVTYNISVYATKAGYEDSETATATLCWIDVDPKTEGIVNGVASVRSYGVMIQASEGFFNISGLEVGTPISVYNTAGQMVGSAKATSETTIVNTTLRNGEIGIVKIGDKSVKVLMK